MTSNTQLAAALRARLAEMDKERDHLVALLSYYGEAPVQKSPASPGAQTGLFEAKSGGPTERIMKVVSDTPGLGYAEVLDRALVGMDTGAGKPRRSLGSTLGTLVKRGKIKRTEGKYYPMT